MYGCYDYDYRIGNEEDLDYLIIKESIMLSINTSEWYIQSSDKKTHDWRKYIEACQFSLTCLVFVLCLDDLYERGVIDRNYSHHQTMQSSYKLSSQAKHSQSQHVSCLASPASSPPPSSWLPTLLWSPSCRVRSGSRQCSSQLSRGHLHCQQEIITILLSTIICSVHTIRNLRFWFIHLCSLLIQFFARLQQKILHHNRPLLCSQQSELLPAQHILLSQHSMALQVDN